MKFDDLNKLHQKKYREKFRSYLVEGEHLVLELQKAAATNAELKGCKLYVSEERATWRSPFEMHIISNRRMEELSETKTPQGIVALVPMPGPSAPRPGERAVYLHEIQDPGNLGTILRTLAWFGNFRCLLSPGSVDPYNSKVLRASVGAIFHVPIEVDAALDMLRSRFPRVACLDTQGTPLPSPGFSAFDCYLFGNEARGVPRGELSALGATAFSIAGSGVPESLNVATSVSICAYELSRARG
jgi:TrmH family RNA methyltransferase